MEEKVMESKKPKRKFIAGAKRIILYGLIFGTVAGSSFATVNSLISKWFSNKEPEKIALSTTIGPEESSDPVQTEEPKKKEPTEEEKKPEEIQNMYSLIGRQTKKTNRSLVEIAGSRKAEKGNNPLITDVVSGVTVAKTKKYIMILTRYSSIKNMQEITVTFMDRSMATGSMQNYDSRTNLAVVKVPVSEVTENTLKNLLILDFGESQYLEQGDLIYVVGQPDGLVNSMEFGYITRKSSVMNMEDFQVDIYGTSLGYHADGYGIVCDMEGKCLGVLDSQYQQQETSTFVGNDKLKLILENLLNQKKQVYVGIYGRGITEEYLEQFHYQTGLYVTEVTVGSPAYEAGIQAGDVIREVNEERVDNMTRFFEIIQQYEPKETLNFKVIRGNDKGESELHLNVKLQERK